MERKTIVLILLLISALALCIVSIWMLADTPKFQGISTGTTDSPKVGITAGLLAAVVGIAIFYLKDLQERKNVMMAAVFVVLIFGITTFALALKEHLDFKKVLDFWDVARQSQPQYREQGFGLTQNSVNPLDMIRKLKNQLIVLTVAGAVGSVLEIAAFILVFKFQASDTTRNALPTDKPY